MNKRILAKNSIIDRLSMSLTISRLNSIFFVICIDNSNEIKFFKNIVKLKHASILRYFNFSDAYICFLNIDDFFSHLKIYYEHYKNSPKDGTNMILSYVFNDIFVNIFNIVLIEKILKRYVYNLDFQNYMMQLIIVIILILEVFVFSIVDLFLLNIENVLLYF